MKVGKTQRENGALSGGLPQGLPSHVKKGKGGVV